MAVTALIAIGTFIWSIRFNKRKLRAELISKSRIEWMNKTRDLYANYIKYFGIYRFDYDQFIMEKIGSNENLTEEMSNIRLLYYELKLYIPNNKSNRLLLKNIELIWGELEYIQDFYNYGRKKHKIVSNKLNVNTSNYQKVTEDYLDNLILTAVTDGSKYFKNEWEKAKMWE